MARVVKQPDVRRQELIAIAMLQFIEQGYERTSIRSIVKAAGGEIGMFYHYFSSKEEIFASVLQHYNSCYISELAALIEEEQDTSFLDLMDKVISHLLGSLPDYGSMQPKKVDAALLSILHQSSMRAIQPIFCEVIAAYTEKNEIRPGDVDLNHLVNFLLFGISGVIHDRAVTDPELKRKSIRKLLIKQLDLDTAQRG